MIVSRLTSFLYLLLRAAVRNFLIEKKFESNFQLCENFFIYPSKFLYLMPIPYYIYGEIFDIDHSSDNHLSLSMVRSSVYRRIHRFTIIHFNHIHSTSSYKIVGAYRIRPSWRRNCTFEDGGLLGVIISFSLTSGRMRYAPTLVRLKSWG